MKKGDIPRYIKDRDTLKRAIKRGDFSNDERSHWEEELRVLEYKLIEAGASVRVTRWNK